MNKKEAIIAMLNGKIMKHANWYDGEYVRYNGDRFVDENDEDICIDDLLLSYCEYEIYEK